MVEWSNYRIVEFANYLRDVILIPTTKKEEAKLPLFFYVIPERLLYLNIYIRIIQHRFRCFLGFRLFRGFSFFLFG